MTLNIQLELKSMEIFLLREEYHKNRRHLLAALRETNAEKQEPPLIYY
jgi:hypothetical protein